MLDPVEAAALKFADDALLWEDYPELQEKFVVLGGVDMFITLLSASVQNEVVSKAAMVLDTVSTASIPACVRIAQPDGVAALLRHLKQSRNPEMLRSIINCLRSIVHLYSEDPECPGLGDMDRFRDAVVEEAPTLCKLLGKGEGDEDELLTRGICAFVHASCMSWGAMVTAVTNCKAIELLLDHCSSAIARYGKCEDSEGEIREIKGPGPEIDVREGWITTQWCVDTLCVLMMSEESHGPFTAADGARIVVSLLGVRASSLVVEQGARLLSNYMVNHKNQMQVAYVGGGEMLVSKLRTYASIYGSGEGDEAAQEHASLYGGDGEEERNHGMGEINQLCAAICNLTFENVASRERVGEAGGCEVLVELLGGNGGEGVKREVCAAIGNICKKNRRNRERIGVCGGCEGLTLVLRGGVSDDTGMQAMRAVGNVAMRMPDNQAKFADALAPSLLLSVLKELAAKLGVVEENGDDGEQGEEEGKGRKGAVGAVAGVSVREGGGGGYASVHKEMYLQLTIAAISALATHERCMEELDGQGGALREALKRVVGHAIQAQTRDSSARLLQTLANTQTAENAQAPPGVLDPPLVVDVNQCVVAVAPAATEGRRLSVGEGAGKGDRCKTAESVERCRPTPRNANVAEHVEDDTPPPCTESSVNGTESVSEVCGGEEKGRKDGERDAGREREGEGEREMERGRGGKLEEASAHITASAAAAAAGGGVARGIHVIDVNGADAGAVVDGNDDDDDEDEDEGVADYHSDVCSVASHHIRQISGSSSRASSRRGGWGVGGGGYASDRSTGRSGEFGDMFSDDDDDDDDDDDSGGGGGGGGGDKNEEEGEEGKGEEGGGSKGKVDDGAWGEGNCGDQRDLTIVIGGERVVEGCVEDSTVHSPEFGVPEGLFDVVHGSRKPSEEDVRNSSDQKVVQRTFDAWLDRAVKQQHVSDGRRVMKRRRETSTKLIIMRAWAVRALGDEGFRFIHTTSPISTYSSGEGSGTFSRLREGGVSDGNIGVYMQGPVHSEESVATVRTIRSVTSEESISMDTRSVPSSAHLASGQRHVIHHHHHYHHHHHDGAARQASVESIRSVEAENSSTHSTGLSEYSQGSLGASEWGRVCAYNPPISETAHTGGGGGGGGGVQQRPRQHNHSGTLQKVTGHREQIAGERRVGITSHVEVDLEKSKNALETLLGGVGGAGPPISADLESAIREVRDQERALANKRLALSAIIDAVTDMPLGEEDEGEEGEGGIGEEGQAGGGGGAGETSL